MIKFISDNIKNLKLLFSVSILFIILSFVATISPNKYLKKNVLSAFEQSDLVLLDDLGFDLVRGQHQYQDCLILAQALNISNNFYENFLMAPYSTEPKCNWLYRYINSPDDVSLKKSIIPYEYYNNGYKTTTFFLASAFPLHMLRGLFKFGSSFLIVYASFLMLRVGQKFNLNAIMSLISISYLFSFSVYHGNDVFGQNLSHGQGDWLSLSFIVLTLSMIYNEKDRNYFRKIYLLYGCVAAYLEYFIGIVPFLGSALLFVNGLLVLVGKKNSFKEVVIDFFYMAFGFIFISSVFMLLKIYIFGSEVFFHGVSALMYRVNGDSYNFFSAIKQLCIHGYWIASGNRFNLFFLVLLCFFTIVTSIKNFIHKEKKISSGAMPYFFGSFLVPFVEFFVFPNHSYIHIWFMARIFTWCIFYILLLFFLGLSNAKKNSFN